MAEDPTHFPSRFSLPRLPKVQAPIFCSSYVTQRKPDSLVCAFLVLYLKTSIYSSGGKEDEPASHNEILQFEGWEQDQEVELMAQLRDPRL